MNIATMAPLAAPAGVVAVLVLLYIGYKLSSRVSSTCVACGTRVGGFGRGGLRVAEGRHMGDCSTTRFVP